jgi:hypothetical protein
LNHCSRATDLALDAISIANRNLSLQTTERSVQDQSSANWTVEIRVANHKIGLAVPAIEKPFGRSNLAMIEQESLHALFD